MQPHKVDKCSFTHTLTVKYGEFKLKIEKINDNQIRFTLSKEDLDKRHLRISELAYGSDKARELFQELMEEANSEVGFEAEDIPLMIEAIPMPSESLILLVTKVDDPEELDARFSQFTPGKPESSAPAPIPACADEILSCFKELENLLNKFGKPQSDFEGDDGTPAQPAPSPISTAEALTEAQSAMLRIYAFDSLSVIRKLAVVLISFYKGSNSLYKDPKTGVYYLVLKMSEHTPEEFNKVCNMVSEYGEPIRTTYATLPYFEEHFKPVLANTALTELAKLK